MQRPTYGISNLATTTYTSRNQPPRFHVCISLAPKPMTVVFGLGTKLHVRMRTTLENGVLRNGQQPGSDFFFWGPVLTYVTQVI